MSSDTLAPVIEERDLFQSVMLRLVADDCAVMRAFAGSTETQWLTYLAVTARSVVRDQLKSQSRRKRADSTTPFAKAWHAAESHKRNQYLEIHKHLLAAELRTI
jgi:DNA-directed RNA polymerase specialized sigma24 family protein